MKTKTKPATWRQRIADVFYDKPLYAGASRYLKDWAVVVMYCLFVVAVPKPESEKAVAA